MVVIVTGGTGAGTSIVGAALARATGWRFIDGDGYRAQASRANMSAGESVTAADRASGLASLHGVVASAVDRREPLSLACSALTARDREILRGHLRAVRFVYLKAGEFADLEEPEDALTLDATQPERIIEIVRREFGI